MGPWKVSIPRGSTHFSLLSFSSLLYHHLLILPFLCSLSFLPIFLFLSVLTLYMTLLQNVRISIVYTSWIEFPVPCSKLKTLTDGYLFKIPVLTSLFLIYGNFNKLFLLLWPLIEKKGFHVPTSNHNSWVESLYVVLGYDIAHLSVNSSLMKG